MDQHPRHERPETPTERAAIEAFVALLGLGIISYFLPSSGMIWWSAWVLGLGVVSVSIFSVRRRWHESERG